MKQIKNQFASLTMKVQIGLYLSFILIVLLALLVVLFNYHSELLIPQLTSIQQKMYKQNSKSQLNHILHYHKKLVTSFVSINGEQLKALHQLLLVSQQQQFSGYDGLNYAYSNNDMFPDSINLIWKNGVLRKRTLSFMCGENKTQFNNSNPMNQQMYGFSNILGEVGTMLNSQTLGINAFIYGALYSDPNILYTYPCLQMKSYFYRYDPTQRPWYTKGFEEHQKNTEGIYQVKFTEPYLAASNTFVDFSIILPQVDKDNKFIGTWAVDVQGQMFAKYLQKSNMVDMMILTNKDGILIVHDFLNSTEINNITSTPLYFQNESITGYSIQDWNIITNNITTNNNCNPTYQLPGYICRHNSVLMKDLHIFSTYLPQYEFYIIILSDQSIMQFQIEADNQYIIDFIQTTLINTIMYSLIVLIVLVLIFVCFIGSAILTPIHNVQQIIKKTLSPYHQDYSKPINLTPNIFNSHIIKKLLTSFNHLLSTVLKSQMTKSVECYKLEAQKYPLNRIGVDSNQYLFFLDSFSEYFRFINNRLISLYNIEIWRPKPKYSNPELLKYA